MQINPININNNSTSFKGVIYNNKQNFIKAGLTRTFELISSDVVSSFKKKSDYNLIINADYRGRLSYKIESIGQGIKGFFKNIKAPWINIKNDEFSSKTIAEYMNIWHKKK